MTDNSTELLDFVSKSCNSRETFEQSIKTSLTGRSFKESSLDSTKSAHNQRTKYASLVHENMSDVLRRAAEMREIYGKKLVYEDDYDQICAESDKSSVRTKGTPVSVVASVATKMGDLPRASAGINDDAMSGSGTETHIFEKRVKTENFLKTDLKLKKDEN